MYSYWHKHANKIQGNTKGEEGDKGMWDVKKFHRFTWKEALAKENPKLNY